MAKEFDVQAVRPGFDANGAAPSQAGNGLEKALSKVDLADLLPDPARFILPPPESSEVTLGIDDTYTDAGDGTDQIIAGDVGSNGVDDNDASIDSEEDAERQSDTDTFIFGTGNGDDTITDFQQGAFDFDTGAEIPGDILDLTAYGIQRDTDANLIDFHNALAGLGHRLIFEDVDGDGAGDNTIFLFNYDESTGTYTDSVTLLGVTASEMSTIINENLAVGDGTGV